MIIEIVVNNRMKAYVLFGNDDVDDAADHRDEVEYVPRVAEVILSQQPTNQPTNHQPHLEHHRLMCVTSDRPTVTHVSIVTTHSCK